MVTHTTPAQIAAQYPLRSDADLIELVSSLVGEASRRQLWLMFVDSDDHPLPLIVPCAGFPDDPPPDRLELFGARACEIAALTGAAGIVLTWERPGGPTLGDAERRMVTAIAAGITAGGVVVRGAFLSHSNGVVQLTERSPIADVSFTDVSGQSVERPAVEGSGGDQRSGDASGR